MRGVIMRTENELQSKRCVPCEGGITPMNIDQSKTMMTQIPAWTLSDDARLIRRSFTFKNFMQAQSFAARVGELSEAEGHHPDITYGWGYCSVSFFTHKIGGLHENDFIMAAKVNKIGVRS